MSLLEVSLLLGTPLPLSPLDEEYVESNDYDELFDVIGEDE